MTDSRFNIVGVKISNVNIKKSIDHLFYFFDDARSNYICVSNVHTTVTAHENNEYLLIQNNSFMTLPDGKPLSVIGHIKGIKDVKRVTGPDFLERILVDGRFDNKRHFFYGNTKENLEKFIKNIESKYPNTNICGYESSVFRELTQTEKEDLKSRIIKAGADFVWVALGAPRQEVFCAEMCRNSNAVWIGVGGAFNVIAGIIPRAPKWMQDCSLEWLYRLIKEPKRLFKRYLVTNTKFFFYMVESLIRRNDDI